MKNALNKLHEIHEKHENLWWILLFVVAAIGWLAFAGTLGRP